MLTPPKWQTLWLKLKYSSRSLSNKIMFFKPAEKILDDISNCCNSTSKELTLEALSCWRIWIENQLVEDWKQNKTCYSAVRPLLTVKFHPLHKDDDIIEIKLSLMWLALHKIQHFIQLEGPQHILEVFIQSCLSWLSCTEDLLPETTNLILRLINSLFTKDVPDFDKKVSFPPLDAFVLQSNKLFSRLLPSFIEIFHNWGKIKEKTDLLCIWNHFLGHCEGSFKFIPVSIWHKIFKLVENICGDEKETIENKLSVLHKCATSLKSVMYNSKFIDCSQLLTTPAEALLKLVIELSINNTDEKKSFEMFRYCNEISRVLSNQIVHTLGYESCIYILPKLEEISSKSLLWGLWCGLANCFKDEMANVNFDKYSSVELKIFKKLRSVAVNFDLDMYRLDENSILMIQDQLSFLRIGIDCKNCLVCIGKTTSSTPSQENQYSHCRQDSPVGFLVKEEIFPYKGYFGFDINNISHKYLASCEKKEHCFPVFSNNSERQGFQKVNEEIGNNFDKISWVENSTDQRWLRCNFSYKTFNKCNLLFFHTELGGRLTIHGYQARRSFVFAPTYITVILQEFVRKTQKNSDSSSNNLIENIKKIQNKLNQCQFFTPTKFFVSLKGTEGTKFCSDFLQYWEEIEDIVHDVDFGKNLNNLITKNDNLLVCLCMFAFLVNFTFNLFVENSENNSCQPKKFYVGEGTVLSRKITNFTKNVLYQKQRLSKSDFIENVGKIFPRNDENPVVLWSRNNATKKLDKENIQKTPSLQSGLNEDACSSVPNDLVIFKYFDELQNKFSNNINSPLIVNSIKGKRKSFSNETEKYSKDLTNSNTNDVTPRTVFTCGKIWENKNVKVILAPPDVFRSLTFSELNPEIVPKDCNTFGQNQEVTNYLLNEIRCDGWKYSLEDQSPTRKRKLCFDIKPDLKNNEVTDDETIVIKSKIKKLVSPSSKTKENQPLPCKEPYFLRRRPLKLPQKFKEEKDLQDGKLKGNSPKSKVITPTKSNKADGSVRTSEEVLTDNSDVKTRSDFRSPIAAAAVTKVDESCEQDNVCVNGSESEVDVQITETGSDVKRIDFDIADVPCSIVEAADKCDVNDHKIGNKFSDKTDLHLDGECEIGAISSPITSRKRVSSSVNENICVKKLKLEPDTCEESTGETVLKNIETKLDACPDKGSNDSEEGSKKICAEAENAGKKSPVPMAQSRGSRMLALIPESPKINQFYETSPTSKHQTPRPHVNKNSRASKMLALLPEIQDVWPNLESNQVEESEDRGKQDNTKKETSGHVLGKMHHSTRTINNAIVNGSPKESPLRRRKSIRFDDDKNETVTYFTDSPPCLLREYFAKEVNKFKGPKKLYFQS